MAREIRRVAYVTVLDSSDVSHWSGILLYLHDALASVFPEVVRIGPLKSYREPIGIAKRLASWTRKQDHPLWLTKASAKGMARQVEARLEEIKPDAVFCVWHPPVSFLRTQVPVFMFQDCPFEIIQPLYDGMSHFTPAIMEEVKLVERVAAKRCTGIIETSDWAAAEARRLWRLPDEKVASIPFGANVVSSVTTENVDEVIRSRSSEQCSLLWLGKDWERKGGDIAVRTAGLLNQRGIKTKLFVVGADVPSNSRDSFVEAVGFVDKGAESGRKQLEDLLKSCHALILPTKAEAFGIVFLEAAAYAMPSLAPNVMGVGSAVLDGKTGALLPANATADAYADQIESWWKDRPMYESLCRSSLEAYRETFTWEQVARRIRDFMLSRS
ncbi:MAG: glycosyltransferase family 4 protein [Chlorobia bacterium]|nr:glycosyltransferase family 4 protein [Fimbriimonadaceae bacterium]